MPLSDVKVLAIGTRLGQTGTTGGTAADPADPTSQVFTTDAIATLELSPPQAETLINATAMGKISLVLRSVADFGKGATTSAAASGDDNQTVKVIRFGRSVSVTPGSDQGSAPTVNPVAYVAPAAPVVTTTTTSASPPPDLPAPTTTTVTTTTLTPAYPATPLPTVQ